MEKRDREEGRGEIKGGGKVKHEHKQRVISQPKFN
jgi:hypothetical protein